MSRNYDSWERLVAAVLKREDFRQLCRCDSFESCISSSSSDFTETEVENVAHQIEHEWIEQFEKGVYVTFAARRDGTTELKRVRFSRGRFIESEAEAWWSENREKVYKHMDERTSNRVPTRMKEQITSISEGNRTISNPKDLLEAHGRNEYPILETNEVLESANQDGPLGHPGQETDECVEQYEPGVYITLLSYKDGRKDLKRVRFSKAKFEPHEAEAWWVKNREEVYKRYKLVPFKQ